MRPSVIVDHISIRRMEATLSDLFPYFILLESDIVFGLIHLSNDDVTQSVEQKRNQLEGAVK